MILKSKGLIHKNCPVCDQTLKSETWSTLSKSSYNKSNTEEEQTSFKAPFSESKGIPPQFLSTCSIGLHLYSTQYEPTFNLGKCPHCNAILWLGEMDVTLISKSNEEWLSCILETITDYFLADMDFMAQQVKFANNFVNIKNEILSNSDQATKEAILKGVKAFNASVLNKYPENNEQKSLLLQTPIFNSDIPEAKSYNDLLRDDYYSILGNEINDVIKERYIRNWIWINECENKASRAKRVPIPSRLADNLKQLSGLLDETDIADRIRKAEILRELELFNEASKILPCPSEVSGIYLIFVSTIKTLIDENDSKIKRLVINKK